MFRNPRSIIACIVAGIFLLGLRLAYPTETNENLKVTTWDAFGYYMYLPSSLIYNDVTELEWYDEIEAKYELSGGELYQANKAQNGNYVFKYLGGVSLMQLPFFAGAHLYASNSSYEADGFSLPYQYAIAFGALFYCLLGLLILRGILLRYFSDNAVGLGILLLVVATNIPQYVSVDSAMSHSYIFILYPLVLYTTIRWHDSPSALWAGLTGLIIGLATICRPTEAIMFLIPMFWDTHNKTDSRKKWDKVKQNKSHIIYAALFGIVGILPQLIYWYYTTDSLVYNVGSKWFFLNPFFRVLFGWQNGWFVYTPVAILFIVGLFYSRKSPFHKAALWFILLNIWIVISWSDWRYGATYSTRALVQSSAILALPFVALLEKLIKSKWKYIAYPIFGFLIYLNFIQIGHYNSRVIHPYDMNQTYFWSIYGDRNPSALDMSYLDNDEKIRFESRYNSSVIHTSDSVLLKSDKNAANFIVRIPLNLDSKAREHWLKVEGEIEMKRGFYNGYLNSEIYGLDTVKYNRIRLFSPIAEAGKSNPYAFYVKIPRAVQARELKLYVASDNSVLGQATNVTVSYLRK